MDIILGLAVSTHLGLAGVYNEIHPYVEYRSNQFIAGAYYNSISTGSFYLGIENTFDNEFTLQSGIVTGYNSLAPVIPYAKLSYEIKENTEFFVSPSFEKNNNDLNLGLILGIQYFFK